jgi:predicted S18 family serine protease
MNQSDLDSRFEQARKKIGNFDTLQLAYRKSEDSIEAQILEDGCAMVEITQFVASENCLGVELKTKTNSKTKTKTTTNTKTNTNTKTTTKTTTKGVKRSRAE